MGFHVEYWNCLGWKDEFSNALYSKRQQQYGEHFSLSSIYTPQVVVNGETEFVGSNKNKLRSTAESYLKNTPSSILTLNASADKNIVTVVYTAAANTTAGNFII